MNCSYCKKEMKKAADSYTNFGTVLDLEPPEPVLLCKKCVRDEIAFWLELGVMPNHWIMAKYEKALADKLGYIRCGEHEYVRWKKLKLQQQEDKNYD